MRSIRGALSLPGKFLVLVVLLTLAGGWLVLQPGGAAARALFQSPPRTPGAPVSPPGPQFSPVATPIPTQARVFLTPVLPLPTLAPPTLVPTLTPTRPPTLTPSPTVVSPEAKTATAIAMSYLPPPTLTAPGVQVLGEAAVPPPLSEDAAPASADPVDPPVMTPAPSGLTRSLDNGLLLLSYAWLCCGAVVLAGAAVVVALVLRRRA